MRGSHRRFFVKLCKITENTQARTRLAMSARQTRRTQTNAIAVNVKCPCIARAFYIYRCETLTKRIFSGLTKNRERAERPFPKLTARIPRCDIVTKKIISRAVYPRGSTPSTLRGFARSAKLRAMPAKRNVRLALRRFVRKAGETSNAVSTNLPCISKGDLYLRV